MAGERPMHADVATSRRGTLPEPWQKGDVDGRGFRREEVHGCIIYLVGLVVIVMAILSFVGLR